VADEIAGRPRQLDERCHHLGDQPVRIGHELLPKVTNTAQTRWQFNLDSACRRQIDRVVGMESETHPLVRDVISDKPVAQQPTCSMQHVPVPASHDDPSEWTGLPPAQRRSIGLNHRSPLRIHPEGESIASEPVHRNGDLHVLQERAQCWGMFGVMQPRGQMDSQPAWLHDRVVGSSCSLRRPIGELVRAAVLRSTMQRHESDRRTQDTLFSDAGQAEEFSEIDRISLPPVLGQSRTVCPPASARPDKRLGPAGVGYLVPGLSTVIATGELRVS
jgi:hypothetical protein